MNKFLRLVSLVACAIASLTSCKKKDDSPAPASPARPGVGQEFTFDGKKAVIRYNGDTAIILEGNLETMTLDSTKKYLLRGQVFVRDGKTLTIPSGTLIFGEKRTKGLLVIDRGGKIMCMGTASRPVVFTSAQEEGERDKGDWGGIVVLGRARTNQSDPSIEGVSPAVVFGGTNDNDNSGVIRYTRIEYAGIELSPNNETNSLTLGGVGAGTTIEYVQATFGGDDHFEWFGGNVNCKYLVSFGAWDDDFDADFGYSGKVQFGLAIREPFTADQSGSNPFECDNNAAGDSTLPQTQAVFSNITVLGPRDNTGRDISANYANTIHIRRNAAVSILNSVFVGMAGSINVEGTNTLGNYDTTNSPKAILAYNHVVFMQRQRPTDASASNPTFFSNNGQAAFLTRGLGNTMDTVRSTGRPNSQNDGVFPNMTGLGINQDLLWGGKGKDGYVSNPNFAVASGSMASGANFTNARVVGKVGDAFFSKVTYRGAFGATDWTDNWTEFRPLNKKY